MIHLFVGFTVMTAKSQHFLALDISRVVLDKLSKVKIIEFLIVIVLLSSWSSCLLSRRTIMSCHMKIVLAHKS